MCTYKLIHIIFYLIFIHHRYTVLQHDCKTSVSTKHAGSSTCDLCRYVLAKRTRMGKET